MAKLMPGMFTDGASEDVRQDLAGIMNAGHVSNMEQPAAFNAHVRRFCLNRDPA